MIKYKIYDREERIKELEALGKGYTEDDLPPSIDKMEKFIKDNQYHFLLVNSVNFIDYKNFVDPLEQQTSVDVYEVPKFGLSNTIHVPLEANEMEFIDNPLDIFDIPTNT